MKRIVIGIATLAINLGVAPVAKADVVCRTDPGSGYSYTYCHGTDSWGNRYDTVTICYVGNDYCTTKDEN